MSEIIHPIAVIGAGFSGTLTAIQLISRLPADREVILFEQSGEPGPGLAYRSDDTHALLNVPARRMSAYQDDPDHFLRYAQEKLGHKVSGEEFLSRQLYGEYIKSCLAEALAKHQNLKLDFRAVVDVHSSPSGNVAVLTLKDQTTLVCQRVVLATGNLGSAFASSLWVEHTSPARKSSTFDKIKPDETVLIIGTGLTMVDSVLELQRRGHRAQVHAVSRNALLPRPYFPASPLDSEEFEDLPVTNVRKALKIFRAVVLEQEAKGGDWRDLFAALRPLTPAFWQDMPSSEKRRFLRHLSAFWEVHRHQTAPEAHAAIQKLIKDNQLVIHKGTIVSVEKKASRLQLSLAARNRAAVSFSLEADHIIDATGPARDITTINQSLIRNLLRRGFLQPDEFRLGALTHHDYRAIQRSGQPNPWLFIVGPMLRAKYFEAIAVPELRLHTSALATRLVKELQLEPVHG
jgi:uncharacterized NAD(P)/FAD-binding protein YdhS